MKAIAPSHNLISLGRTLSVPKEIEDSFCGIQLPKHLIPNEYKKRFGNLTNLWKYNLLDAWRLIYTIKNDRASVLSVILEWLDHQEYERRFNY